MNQRPTLFSRIRDWVSQLFAPAEDPRQSSVYAFQRQRELLVKVQTALKNLGESKMRINSHMSEVRRLLPHLLTEAQQASTEGKADIARLVQSRYDTANIELNALEVQMGDIQQAQQRLTFAEKKLSAQIDNFLARQELVSARYTAAETQVQINTAMQSVSQELAILGSELAEAEQKVQHIQISAAELDRLIADVDDPLSHE